MKPEEKEKKDRNTKKSGFRLFFKILLGIFLFLLLLVLFVRSPWGQSIIVDRTVSYISKQTNTKVEVEKLFITFSGNLSLEGLYMEDQKGDTLLYSRSLEADIPLWPIIRGKGIAINDLEWNGVRANISRKDTINGFNYQFLIDAFAPADTTTTASIQQDTTAAGTNISLGNVALNDVKVRFFDNVAGLDSKFLIGKLHLNMQEFDLDSMKFRAGDALLENSRFSYSQTKPFPEQEEQEDMPMPVFSVEKFRINNVSGEYQSLPDGLLADVSIDELILELPKADLAQNEILIDRLGLRNSVILVHTKTTSKERLAATPAPDEADFKWPNWNILARDITLSKNHIQYLANAASPKPGVFNPNALDLRDFSLRANHLLLKNGSAEAFVQNLNFREASGLVLHQLNFDLNLSEEALRLTNLNLHLNENRLDGRLHINYSSLESFLNSPEKALVDLELPNFKVYLQDLYQFLPDLKNNIYLASLAKKPIYGTLSAEGKLSEVTISNTRLYWGPNTSVAATGTVFNATDPKAIRFNFPQFKAVTSRQDLLHFIKEKDLGIKIPKDVQVTGQFKGSPQDISADAILNSTLGNLSLTGRFKTEPQIAFQTHLEVNKLQLSQLLQNAQLGPLSLTLEASGSGRNINELDAIVNANVSSLLYNNYEFTNLELAGQLEQGEGFATIDYKDDNLNMQLESFVELDSVSPKVAVQLNLIGADLKALGFSQRAINAAFGLSATFEGNMAAYDLTANITDGVAVYSNESYLLGDFDILAHVREDTTSLSMNNRMIDLRLRSNSGPSEFTGALNRHYDTYFSEASITDTISNPVNLELIAQISPAPIMEEVLFPQLEELDTIHVQVDFREKQRQLTASINLPHAKYFGSVVDSLRFNLNSNREQLTFNFGLKSLDAGPLAIKETILKGSLVNRELTLDFTSNYEGQQLVHVESQISKPNDLLRIHIDPEELVLNTASWNIDPQNEILVGDDFWNFKNFVLERNEQLMRISNELPGVQKDHIGLAFENFRLAALLSYLNPEDVLASGQMNGQLIIEEPFGATGMLADLQINNFGVMSVPLGTLTLDAEAIGSSRYDFDLAIKEGDVDLDLTGNFIAAEPAANLDMNLNLNQVKMRVIEGFSKGAINTTSGNFSGEISVKGTTAAPVYDGILNFTKASFTVAMLDAPFVLPNETLSVDNEGVYLDDFKILDKNTNPLILDGSILTKSLTNPQFDLSFTANNFTALNSTEEDNDLFYGLAVFDATGSLTGNLEVPQVELDLDIKEETNMTYVIPRASLEIEERDGVVVFVNRQNPDRILTQTQQSENEFSISGIALNSYISLEENATFTIVLDQDTGDHIQASGEGDLLFDIFPNGRQTMSGRLEINEGYYEMSLYDLVTRRFDLLDGSSIVWAGDPLDADLNITAVYRVEASASALMAPQITGADMNVRQRYRQELPFLVYLNIEGELTQPQISFGLDMPEDDKGAIGGQVYGRVQQINQQENELNKQVFSLLVLNRFFPDSGSDGSAGGSLSFARDNLNEALSDQLNIFSDRLLGETGIDLNFGLDTYTDYQGESPQERTQLDITAQKSLMDDRLLVSVGSEVDLQGSSQVEEASPVIGNVSIEYLLTENGRFRIKAFRRKSYENVIDGQLIISGLSLIFTQDFNKFHELWDQIVKDEEKKKTRIKDKQEQTKTQ